MVSDRNRQLRMCHASSIPLRRGADGLRSGALPVSLHLQILLRALAAGRDASVQEKRLRSFA